MSATVGGGGWGALPGWSRMAIVFGIPTVAIAGGAYWAWSGKAHAPAAMTTRAADWGRGQLLPAPIAQVAAPAPAVAPAPQAPKTDVKQPVAPPVTPPSRVMSVWVDKSGLDAVSAEAAKRREALTTRPSSGPGGSGARDPSVLVPGEGAAAGSEYAQRMQATAFGDTAPTPPNLPPAFTIKKGYRIACLPDQPLSSEMVGPIQCTTTQAVLSMDGNNTLLPVGTEIHGTIERGLSNGGKRLFPIWTDMLTPKPYQLAIPLGAPSADEMGQSGLPGDVNTHFWLKARDLALVSVIQMVGGIASSAAQSGNGNNTNNFNLNGPVSASQTLAERAFGGEMSIADTFYRGPAQPIVIVTNKYINLQHYYRDVVIR